VPTKDCIKNGRLCFTAGICIARPLCFAQLTLSAQGGYGVYTNTKLLMDTHQYYLDLSYKFSIGFAGLSIGRRAIFNFKLMKKWGVG